MKKILFFAIGLFTSVAVLAQSGTVENYDGTGINYSYEVVGHGNDPKTYEAILTDGTKCQNGTITIPDKINVDNQDYDVIRIKSQAFKSNNSIEHVIIKAGIKVIENNAFWGCSKLQKIEFPSSIQTIGENVFGGCNELIYIGWDFADHTKFSPSIFPDNKLMTLFVPNANKNLYLSEGSQWKIDPRFGNRIYGGKMTDVEYDEMTYLCASDSHDAILVVGKDATSVPIPSSFEKTIDAQTTITYYVRNVGKSAFYNKNVNLKSITISDGVTVISKGAFQGCSKLENLELPSDLKIVGSNAFDGCSALQKIVFPSTLETIYSEAFKGSGLLYIGWPFANPSDFAPSYFPNNEMMTLFVPNANREDYLADNSQWKKDNRFEDRIYGGTMEIVLVKGMTYLCASDSHDAILVTGKNESFTIESSFTSGNTYYVRMIGKSAFYNCDQIQNLTIGEDITSISSNAFQDCSKLEVLKLPSTLNKIGSNAFNGCSKLVRVESGIETPFAIPDNLFTNANSNDKILYVPQNKKGLYEAIIGWNNGFTYRLEGTMQDIVFKYKDDQGTDVCDMTFATASQSNDAVLIKVSDNEAKRIEIPALCDNHNVIGVFKDAFKPSPTKTTALEELSFIQGPKNLTLGKDALNGCSKLRILKLPSTLNKLGSGAFTACSNLEHILFKSNASIIVENVFGEKTRNSAILYVPSGSSETDFVNIGWNPNNIIKAEYLEEFNDKNNGMTYVGWRQESAETGTAKLIKGKPGTSDEEFSILSSAISDKDVNYDVIAIADNAFSSVGTAFKNLTISEGILQIGMSAFQGRSSINRVKLPSSLTKIGEKAFYGCGNLTDIEAISKDVSLNVSEIGASAFYNCTSLEKITLPASLTSIGLSAFAGCSKLKEIESKIKPTIYNPLFEIDNTVFPNYSATLYVPSGTKDAYLATNSWQEFGDNIRVGSREVYEDNGLKYAYASEETTAILIRSNPTEKSVKILSEIPNSNAVVTSILESAFENNTSIESVFIPGKVTSIGSKAFNKCSNLKTVQFGNDETPSNLSSIGVQAFANCRNLKTIISTIPSNKLCDISNVFTYDDAQFAMSPEVIYIPVEDDSKYTTIWNIGLFAGKFVVGYPGYDGEAEGENGGIGWYYDYLTIDNKDIENTKNTATLKRASTRIEENGDLLVSGWVTIKGKLYKVTGIDKQAFNDYDGKSSVNKLRIDDNIVNIGASAFSALSNLKQVWFPKTLNEIGANAFNVNNIKYVCCEASTHPNSVSAIFSESKDVYLFVPSVEAKDDYVQETIWTNNTKAKVRVGYFVDEIPLTNTVYEKMEFVCLKDKKDGVKKTAILNKSVTTKEDVEIPSSVILQQEPYVVTAIAESAFSGSSKLKLIRIPQNIKEIGDKAFDGCTMLTEIESQIIPTDENPLFEIENTVFSNYSATLYVPTVEAKAKYMTTNGWKQFGDNISAGSRDVYSYEGLNYVYATYGETATLIKSNPTEKAVKILDKIPNSNAVVTSILESAFENNTSIESVFIPGEVTSIGSKAFNKCSNLKTIQFGDDETTSELASIGEKSFANCRNLKTIISTIPSNKLCDISNVFTYDDAQFAMSPDVIYIPVEDDSKYTTIWNIGLFAGKFVSGYPGYDGVGEKGWLYDYLTVDDLDIDKTKNTATLKKAKQSAADENHVLTIPSKVTIKERKYKVTKIGDNAFNEYAGKNSDEGLKIQKTITEIGKNAFYGFSKLKIVKLPKSLKSIGSMAFSGCGSITHVCSEMESPIMGDDVFSTPTTTATFFVPTLEGYNKNILDKFPNVVVGKFDGDKQEGELIYSCYTDADEHKAIVTKSGTGVVEATIKESVKTSEDGDDYTVTTIGKNAFKGCTKLKKIELPSKLASIGNVPPVGENAFEECVILDEIVSDIKGDDLKPIPTNVFSEYTRNNAKLYVPDNVTKYKETEGWDVFKSSDPDNYIVGKWVDSKVQDDFMQYRYHTGIHDAIVIKIDFPNNEHKTLPIKREVRFDNDPVPYLVSTIAPTSITNKERIEYITIENGISTIEADAFKGCINLKKVDFPSSLTTIGNNAFYGDSKLEKLRLEGVVTIGDNTFQGCTSLQKIWLPASLTSIGSKAFNGCNNLTRICIEAIPTMENTDAFSTYSKTLLFVPTGTLSTIEGKTGWSAFSRKYEGYYEDESPDGVDRAYIYLKQTDDKRTAILTKSLIADPISKTVVRGDYTYNVTIIGESAFNVNGVNLVNLDLPETITDIEKKAFQNQKNLTSITLPSNLKIIGNDAFSGNSKLESLTFSDKVEFIGDNAFKGCSSLKKLVLPASLKTIGDGAFSSNTNLNDLTISEGINSIGDEAFKNCNSLKNIVLPSTLKTIGSTAFDGCDNLTEVISKVENTDVIESNSPSMPNAILYVQEATKGSYKGRWNCLHILEGDRKLSDNIGGLYYAYSTVDEEAILIDATSEAIDENKKVVIPGTINIKIGDDNKPYKVVAIDMSVFKGNTEIKSLVIEDNIEIIGANAFQGCSNLKMIELPASLKTVGESAFDGCNNLTEVVSHITNYGVIEKYANLLPYINALYVPGTSKSDYISTGWKYKHIYGGKRETKEYKGLVYAYSPGVNDAIIVEMKSEGIIDGKVTIPPYIPIGEGENPEKYNVVDIDDNVFKNNTAIETIEIGENIKSIPDNAFDGCINLKEVISKIVSSAAISGITLSLPDAVLYVPDVLDVTDADPVETYKSTWTFADYYVGERLTKEINGMSFVCATGEKKAMLVKTDAEGLAVKWPDGKIEIPGSVSITIKNGEDDVELTFNEIAIRANAFSGNTNIVSVEIAENVKTIGANAFQGCSNLNRAWLPSTLESIDDNAFDGCDKITYISTKNETPLVAPNMADNAFSSKSATLFVPNQTAVTNYANDELWSSIFPIIREGYFVDEIEADNITYQCLTVGKDVKRAILVKSEKQNPIVEIPEYVSLNNSNDKYDVAIIGKNAFTGSYSNTLEKLVLPSTLREIDDYAFDQCTKLSMIISRISKNDLFGFHKNVFPDAVYSKAIVYVPYDEDGSTLAKYTDESTEGWNNFVNWTKGEKWTATVDNKTYDYFVGESTAILTGTTTSDEVVTIDGAITVDGKTYTVTTIGESAFNKNPNRGKMTKLIISENIKTIDANAFQGCNNLKKVWLPSTLTSIGAKAFDGCNAITHVSSKVDNPTLISENVFPTSATLFVPKKSDYSSAKFSYVAEGELVDDLSDNGMTYDCLKGNKAILKKYTGSSNDVDIPSSVKIGTDSYTVAIIAKPAFTGKTNIERLVIPAGVGEIDAETFNACSKLKWIESKIENPISISSNVFANYTATLFIPKNNVTEYENKGWKFLNIYVGERIETTISDGCTYVYSTGDKKAILIKTATNDKEVTVNGTFKIGKDEYTVTAIAESVFKGKTKMETLKISENIKNIGAYAFQGCTNLQKIEFPATLKKIGSNAFDGCTSLVSVTCEGKEPAEIGAGAFPSYNITVNVPKEAVDTYKGDTYWREFTTILGITTTVTDDPTGPYNITAEAGSGATPTVELWNGMDASGEYVIPEKVEIDGSDYMVTAIAAGAFEDNTNLTNITIPSSVSSIGTSAFAGCSNLKSITVKWENPLPLSVAGARGMTRSGGSSIFDGVNKNTCILYVPAGCVDKYKAAAVWKEFKNILEIGTTAINGVVIAEDGKPFDIYNMQGRKVRDNVTSFDGLPSGVYIVNGKKVMVK